MALISPQQSSVAGPVVTYGSVGASDTFAPSALGVLHYRTAGTASNLTIVVPGNNDYGEPHPDKVIAFGATEARAIATGPLVKYADSSGLVTVTSSSQTNFTVAYVLN